MDEEAKPRARGTLACNVLSWIFSVVTLAGIIPRSDIQNITNGNPKTGVVMLFAVFAFLAITVALVLNVYYACKEYENVTFRKLYISSGFAALFSVISFGVASNDTATEYGYGFVFEVLLFVTSSLSTFFAFITDRSLGNV